MSRRSRTGPPIKMHFWTQKGELWYASIPELNQAIKDSGHSDEELKRRAGAGFIDFEKALAGEGINGWGVSHIEWTLSPHSTWPK